MPSSPLRPDHVPAALLDIASKLPTVPGVYLFMGDGPLPLYIGKSVNIRSRVQQHLRSPQESRWVRHSQRIEHITTAGEVGALLLEAQLIKAQQPLMNQRLRRNRQLCALRWRQGRPEVVQASEVDFACTPGLHGPFASKHAAEALLLNLADEHQLCLASLGLEQTTKGRPCFRSAIGKCAGVCRGHETQAEHDARLHAALSRWQLRCWPYPGAVALIERRAGACDHLVVKNWCFLGSADSMDEACNLRQVASAFDADGYRILCAPIFRGDVEIIQLPEPCPKVRRRLTGSLA